MKHKVCISIDPQIMENIERTIQQGTFRNTSHAFEFAIKKLLEEKK